ncbi:HEAT repeat domain-containing protein [Micromonospora sp. CPCC 206061]|uniref:HEAT repeat domain-containing protein n=1 Tax=Micromonospora sp. CPCC 206061 TaxID=3122410 RepID=UPI002FEFEDE3
MSANLDDVPWRSLESTSGSATVVHDLLRDARVADDEELDEIADNLSYELGNDGVPLPAAPAAVAFLVDLVVARPVANLVRVLADLVPPELDDRLARPIGHEYANLPEVTDPARDAVQRALGDRLPDLLPLLDADTAEVRLWAARLLGGLPRHAEETLPALRAAAGREPDPLARASAVLAVGALAADTGRAGEVLPWLRRVLADDPAPPARTAAAVAAGWATTAQSSGSAPLGPAERQAILAAAADPPAGVDDEFAWSRGDLYPFLRSASPDDRAFAVELAARGRGAPASWRRVDAIGTAWYVMARWRSAPPEVVPVLATFTGDAAPLVRQEAAHVLAWAGQATALVVDPLVALLADATPDVVDGGADSAPPVAWSALLGLARVDSGRVAADVARLIADPRAFPAHPNQPSLVADVLAAMADRAADLLPAVRDYLAGDPMAGDRWHLHQVLAGIRAWPGLADGVGSELLALAGHAEWPKPLVTLLGELGPAVTPASDHLRQLLRSADARTSTPAAVALWRIGGDPGEALAVLGAWLRGDDQYGARLATQAAERIGRDARDLAGDVAPLLRSEVREVRVAAGRALWRMTGDTEAVLETLLEEAEPDRIGMDAIELLAEIGPPAGAALPDLTRMAGSEGRIPLQGVRLRGGRRVIIYNQGRDYIVLDEACRDLARHAIARIAR